MAEYLASIAWERPGAAFTASFAGARHDLVVRHLETLALMGEVTIDADGRYQAVRKVA